MTKFLAFAVALVLSGAVYAQVTLPTLGALNQADLVQVLPLGSSAAGNKYAKVGTVSSTASYAKSVPLTAFSLTFAQGQQWIYIVPAGTLATGTITFATLPSDGQIACMRSTETQTALTLAAASGDTINDTITAMTADTTYCWMYVRADLKWYRTQ